MRPEAVIVALLVVLGVGAAFLGAGDQGKATKTTPAPVPALTARVARIAHRVETLRGLDFRHPVRSRVVSPRQARADGIADLDRSSPAASRHADEEVLELLGLLPPGADLRALLGTAFGEQVAGYYDPRTKRLAVVSGPAGGTRGALGEVVLAHELTHALEDQRFGLPQSPEETDDAASARTALEEGTATALMLDYARRYLPSGALFGDALGALGSQTGQTRLPRYVQDSLEFPYTAGLGFVQALRARVGGGWRLVDRAVRSRPPLSTEQVLHPEKWFARERPAPVSLPRHPGRRLAAGGLGEWDTAEILAGGLSRADATVAARGWGGGRYALWRAPGRGRCAPPCRARDRLELGWRWDTRRDAREFRAALVTWLAAGLRARPDGRDRWVLSDGVVRLRTTPRGTLLEMAPGARPGR